MGEEKKKEEEEKKEEAKEEEEQVIVLKVDMHCHACARKVARALKGFEGVEVVSLDSKASKVVVKGKTADPIKVCERLHKKSGKKVELISPLPKPPPEENTNKQDDQQQEAKQEQQQPKQDKKDEPPPVITVFLKVSMHCDACADLLQKSLKKIKGVEEVKTDLSKDQVEVKGVIEASKLVHYIYKKTGKHASVVEEKQEEKEKKDEEATKKDEEAVKKKEEDEVKGDQDDESKLDIKRNEYWMQSRYYSDYYYPPQQFFSDENPNACSIM